MVVYEFFTICVGFLALPLTVGVCGGLLWCPLAATSLFLLFRLSGSLGAGSSYGLSSLSDSPLISNSLAVLSREGSLASGT